MAGVTAYKGCRLLEERKRAMDSCRDYFNIDPDAGVGVYISKGKWEDAQGYLGLYNCSARGDEEPWRGVQRLWISLCSRLIDICYVQDEIIKEFLNAGLEDEE